MIAASPNAGATAGACAMLRVRLKADGRLVEVLPDGSERAIATDPRAIATAAHNAARAAERVNDAALCPQYPQPHRSYPGGFRRADRRAGRNRAQLGAGQALAARAGRARFLKVIEEAPEAAFAVLGKAR